MQIIFSFDLMSKISLNTFCCQFNLLKIFIYHFFKRGIQLVLIIIGYSYFFCSTIIFLFLLIILRLKLIGTFNHKLLLNLKFLNIGKFIIGMILIYIFLYLFVIYLISFLNLIIIIIFIKHIKIILLSKSI